MSAPLRISLLLILCSPLQASLLRISAESPVRLPGSEVEGNYSTSHLYVDEVAGTQVPVTVFFDPQVTGVQTCEVFTNLNRRERAGLDANGDGVEDGIRLPDGNAIPSGSEAHYYKPWTMSLVSGGYQTTLLAGKTGAYRLTVRWRLTSDAPGSWRWYSQESAGGYSKRDHAIVVSPVTARSMTMYELNVLNVEAEGATEAQRSTFVDLWDGPGSTRTPRWSLDYVRALGVNWLWFQPVHPIGVDGRHLSAANINTRQPGAGATTRVWNGGAAYEDVNFSYSLGSPYAVRNFFEIEPRMSKANTRAAALAEFQDFVAAADSTGGADGVNVMLDAPFNHTSWDCELGARGVALFSPAAAPGDMFRNREARVFSRSGNYGMRAFSAGSIAPAPDRGDFSKFLDTYDIYFGRYASLVLTNPADNGARLNEGDWFDTSIGAEGSSGDGHGHFDTITQNVWRYFADYCLYWLDQTGCPAGTSPEEQVWRGIDGLRADFAQGIPPQVWEYIINKARARKWAFVFMAESLDGGEVTYRSSRHFDVLNENILFTMKGLSAGSGSMTSSLRTMLEQRRSSYGQAMVLLNTTSHDEDHYADPWEALLRTAVCGTSDGVPMVCYGQEMGMSTLYGVDLWERNLGKFIPHFKTWNSLMPLWTNTDYGLDQLYPVYAGIGAARQASPALRASARYFLNLKTGGVHERLFSVAKFTSRNTAPNFADTVFAFANLDRNADQSGNFNVSVDADGNGANDFGIRRGRSYRLRNLAAHEGITSGRRLLPYAAASGDALLDNGLPVTARKVPVTNAAWSSAPYEALYLKLEDVSPPPAPAMPYAAQPYVIGDNISAAWTAVVDGEAGISGYTATLTGAAVPAPQSLTTAGTSTTFPAGSSYADGAEVGISVRSLSLTGIASAASPVLTLRRLHPETDFDYDGIPNFDEDIMGTDPLNAGSVFRLLSQERAADGTVSLTLATVAGRSYTLRSSTDLVVWVDEGPAVPGTGASISLTDTLPGEGRKFYTIAISR